ncbi:MAG: histidinol-phosphate aminotransferase family protein [bacterium]|nr:histidinol-phosphate aminotransferase family protein [bacterium]
MTPPAKVYFDRNENRYGPAPACMQVLREAEGELLFNYSRTFQRGYYSELSARLAAIHGVDEQRIILGYGCEDILKEAVHHFLPAGRAVLIPSASWWYYHAVAAEVGGVTTEYPLRPVRNRYEYDVEALLRLRETADPALVLLASPNNPTGNSLGRSDLRRLLEAYRGVPFVLDQAYFGFTPAAQDDVGALTGEFGDLLVLRTFSKLYALAGVRIGYALCGNDLDVFRRFCARNLGYNRISEKLALAALDSPGYYRDVAAGMSRSRQQLYDLFGSIPGCAVYESEANFVLVKMPPEMVVLLERELNARGMIVKFLKEPGFTDHARISLGNAEETDQLVAAIGSLLARPAVRTRAIGESA